MLSPKQLQQPRFSFGKSGEEQATEFLRAHGYQVLDHNVRLGNREIDLVVKDTQFDEIVFVEVKNRASSEFGNPSQAVNRQKLWQMQKVARAYLREHRLQSDYRFDIIAITPEGIEHFENVTWGR